MPDPRSHQFNVEDLDFLNTATINNFYSQVYLENLSSTDITSLSQTEDPGISTAAIPYLPMTITVPDTQGNGLTFTMLINPENMNHGKTNATYYSYTRKGYVTQLWGPNQDLITATGKSAAFYIEGQGLTDIGQRKSLGFHNFMSLVAAYRNNGYQIIDKIELQSFYVRVINTVPGIRLTYDGQEYLGHFNNFTLDDLAESPFIFGYNFEFVVSSLSSDYTYIRGHFLPLNYEKNLTPAAKAKLIDDEKLITPDPVFVQPVELIKDTTYIPVYQGSSSIKKAMDTVANYETFINEAAKEFKVDPNLIKGLMTQESVLYALLNGQKPENVVSPSGAIGIMQIIPSTGAEIAGKLNESFSYDKLYDPQTNIRWGTKYLADQLAHFGDEKLALAAYNGGPTHLENVGRNIDRMLPETQIYVPRVEGFKGVYSQQALVQTNTTNSVTTDQIVADQKDRNTNPTPKQKWESDYQQATGVPPVKP